MTSSLRPVTPNTILAARLHEALAWARTHDVAASLVEHLEACTALAAPLEPYLERQASPESPGRAQLAADSRSEPWKRRFETSASSLPLEAEMLSGRVEGQLLRMLVQISGARRVLDIGLFTGYSALTMAEALPHDGLVTALEIDSFVADFAKTHLSSMPGGEKIEVRLGPALETLLALSGEGRGFDLVFIDAAKTDYPAYYRALFELELLHERALVVADNTLYQGEVYASGGPGSSSGVAVAEFNELVRKDPRVEQVLLPVRDGLTLARRVA